MWPFKVALLFALQLALSLSDLPVRRTAGIFFFPLSFQSELIFALSVPDRLTPSLNVIPEGTMEEVQKREKQ